MPRKPHARKRMSGVAGPMVERVTPTKPTSTPMAHSTTPANKTSQMTVLTLMILAWFGKVFINVKRV
jgi:hypothetical protein